MSESIAKEKTYTICTCYGN